MRQKAAERRESHGTERTLGGTVGGRKSEGEGLKMADEAKKPRDCCKPA